MERVILLNNDYNFLGIITWKRAVNLVVSGRVEVLKATNRIITNASKTFEMYVPEIVRLKHLTQRVYRAKVPYSKKNVITRDQSICQYCGERIEGDITIDHVIPASKGGRSSFENCVASCKKCNNKKGDKFTHECGMHPKRTPYRPTVIDFISLKMKSMGIDEVLSDIWEY